MTPRFGVQVAPLAADPRALLALARQADEDGLELLGMQDHPYASDQLDTFSLLAMILSDTEQLRVFPDVASLPLRGPAMIAKAAATLSRVSGGRFDLGLGSGAFWPAIEAMGGPRRTPSEALAALEESIEIMRTWWERPQARVEAGGDYYRVAGVRGGPEPASPIGIWVGSVGPRAHAVTGRLADGWAAPIPHYLHYEKWREAQGIIDAAAREAGRDPGEITRIAQLVGNITEQPAGEVLLAGERPVRGSASEWVEAIAHVADMGFDSFVYWPEATDRIQLARWAREVVPAARERLAS